MKTMIAAAAMAVALASVADARADDLFGLELSGSLREGGFSRYVPAVTNPVFNETPFITTEFKPLFIYHRVPEAFPTEGGSVVVAAAQARVALTERFGIIATLDGYTSIDFDKVLGDDDGPNDVAFGAKYAFLYAPEDGTIATAGLRYTAPAGNLETSGIDLAGQGNGFLNPFLTGAWISGPLQLQGSVGTQIALSGENSSFVHASAHADYEVAPGVFPFVETNLFAYYDGGDVIPEGPLSSLTGAEIADIGTGNPVTTLTFGGGLRARLTDWAIAGAGVEGNVLNRQDSVFGLRVTTDLTIHF